MSEDNPFKTVLGGFRAPEFKGFTSTSHYVETRDGVKIAVDILLPKPVEPGRKFTTILIQTRYWRAIALKPPVGWFLSLPTNPAVARNMVKYGYAIATVDVRGTGASTGNRLRPLDKPEVLDGADIMNWVIGQPWSDGNVVSWGNSYSGMTAEASLSLKHQAMRGAILRHNPYDLYSDAFLPGGVFNKGFIHYWSSIGKSLDTTAGTALAAFKPFNPLFGTLAPLLVSGVNPVTNRKDLNLPAKIHLDNSYPENYGDIVEFRDTNGPSTWKKSAPRKLNVLIRGLSPSFISSQGASRNSSTSRFKSMTRGAISRRQTCTWRGNGLATRNT